MVETNYIGVDRIADIVIDLMDLSAQVCQAAAAGNIDKIKELFTGSSSSAFQLSNDVDFATSFTPLHYAASRDHFDLVKWLIEEGGAIVDLEDREGETALLKASYRGHLPIIKYLVEHGSNVCQADNDGWTALHNAASRGYLTIVRFLIESGDADPNVQSKLGYTPLMNAASKGHLPIVQYLLKSTGANPLLKNKFGESAYECAAAIFEVYICEVLERYEAEWWRKSNSFSTSYNVVSLHATVPVLLHENQRASVNVSSLIRGSHCRFSSKALHPLKDMRGPWSRPDGRPYQKDNVELPDIRETYGMTIELPANMDTLQKAWFWLSDWQVDTTHPRVDASDGWQYARSFEDPEDAWIPDPPQQGNNWVRRRRWVRIMKRRVDICIEAKKRDESEIINGDGNSSKDDHHYEQELHSQATLPIATDYIERAQYIIGKEDDDIASRSRKQNKRNELRRTIRRFESAITILEEGIEHDDDEIHKDQAQALVQAWKEHVTDLKETSPHLSDVEEEEEDDDDDDEEEEQFNYGEMDVVSNDENDEEAKTFVYKFDDSGQEDNEEEDNNDSAFVYPAESSNSNKQFPNNNNHDTLSNSNSNSNSNSHSQSTSFMTLPPTLDITSALSSAPTFAYPTNDTPSRPSGKSKRSIRAVNEPVWEDDAAVDECRLCTKRFSLWVRRHHCRLCGLIYCDKCSSHRALLPPTRVVTDPSTPESWILASSGATLYHRVCDSCYTTLGRPSFSKSLSIRSNSGILSKLTPLDQNQNQNPLSYSYSSSSLQTPPITRRTSASSILSAMQDCPVCQLNLSELPTEEVREAHVQMCLDGRGPRGNGSATTGAGRYLVYNLPADSALVHQECVICFESFLPGNGIARLDCLCSFHVHCIRAWFARGKECPVHGMS